MENTIQDISSGLGQSAQASPQIGSPAPQAPNPVYTGQTPSAPAPVQTPPPKRRGTRRSVLIVVVILLILALLGALAAFLIRSPQQENKEVTNKFDTVQIPLDEFLSGEGLALLGTRNLTINGRLQANDAFIISPSAQPSNATAGQIYYDQTNNELAYYNGSEFIVLPGDLTTGPGISNTNGQLANTGVLALQGQTGNVTLTAGPGIAVDGTTLSNTGVLSLGDATGDITLGSGLAITDNVLRNSGVNSLTAGTVNLTITNDGAGNLTISDVGGGSGTVTSSGGTVGRIAKFTGVQNIEDSLLSESGATITVNGNLTVTGNTNLDNPLTVGNGGTGATSLSANGVVISHGASAFTAVTAGAPGECLLSTAGAPAFGACPGGGGGAVDSLNSLTGALVLANSTGAGTTITIDDASTSQKGIAQFNATNFSASGGTINTIQNINTGASPTFVGQTLTGDLAVNGGDITSTGALNITPGGTLTVGATSQTLTLQGGASTSLSATSGANSTVLNFQVPAANVTYRLPTASAGSYDICSTAGNCAGVGGGVTTAGGTTNRLAKFTAAQGIGDSTITDNGTTVSTTVDLIIQGGDVTVGVQNSQIGTINLAHSASGFLGSIVQGALTDNRTYTLPDASGTFCLTSGNCSGSGSSNTLQASYDAGNAITTTNARDIDIVLANTTTDSNFDLVVADGSTSYVSFARADGAGTADPSQMLLIDNLDADRALPIGLKLQSAAGGMTTAIDASDAEIVTALSVGDNTISGGLANLDFTNFDVVGSTGNITTAGDLALNGGDITSTGAITITSSGAGNDITLNSADTIELQDNTNIAGDLQVNGGDINTASSASGTPLNIKPGGVTNANGTGVALGLQGGDATSATCGTACTGGDVTIAGGTATGGAGTRVGGSVTINAGAGASANGSINIGTTIGAVTIGSTSVASSVTLRAANSGNIFIGSSGTTATVQIGNTTGAVSQAINIGNNATGSSTSTVTIGSVIGSSSSSLRSGATGNITLNAGGTNVLTATASTLGLVSTTTSINHNFNGATNINTGTSTGLVTIGGGSGGFAVDSTAFDVTSGGAVSGVTTLSTSGIITQGTLGTADPSTVTYLCRNASNQISSCSSSIAGAAFAQGGNSFGAAAILGTNDANSLSFETGGTSRVTLGSTGGLTVLAGNAFTVTSALTSLTGATTGDALNVSNSTSTGNIALFKDNATNVVSIADGGASTFQNSVDGANAFRVLNSAGGELIGADTSSSILRLLNNNSGELIGTGPSTPAGQWTPGATLTSPRGSGATVVLNGYLYSIAGGDTGGGTNDVYYTKLNSDGSMSGWIQTTDYPYNVYDHAVTTYNGYIYGHGGTGSAATGQDMVYAKPNSDGSISSWTIQDNPTNLVNHSLAGMQAYNGYIYITAGSDASTRRNVYYGRINGDGSVPTFTVKTDWLPISTEFNPGQMVIANGFMYVMGSANYDKFWYGRIRATGDPGTPAGGAGAASPTTTASTVTSRKYASLAVMNGYLYVIAGSTNGLTTTEYVPFDSSGNISQAFTTADIEFPQALSVCPLYSPTYNGYIYVVACGDTNFNPLDLTFYASGSRVKVGGSLDLVAYSGEGASEGQTGGQLNAGNTNVNGLLSVTGNAVFKDGAAVSNALSVQAYSNTNAVFSVLNASGVPQFSIDNTNSRTYIGNQTSDTTGALLVLDTKSDANDPTGVNGGMYYSTNTNTFRCYENSLWYDCISRHKIVLGSDVTDSAGNACTMTDITGLTFSVTSGTNYRFHANLIYTAAATSTGARFSVNGPATPTLLSFESRSGLTATTEAVDYVNAYDGGTCTATSPSAATQGNTATVEGVIRPSASGTFAMRVGTEVDTSAIVVKTGSTLEWW